MNRTDNKVDTIESQPLRNRSVLRWEVSTIPIVTARPLQTGETRKSRPWYGFLLILGLNPGGSWDVGN